VQQWIIYARSHYTENYHVNLKSGVNFQVFKAKSCTQKKTV